MIIDIGANKKRNSLPFLYGEIAIIKRAIITVKIIIINDGLDFLALDFKYLTK